MTVFLQQGGRAPLKTLTAAPAAAAAAAATAAAASVARDVASWPVGTILLQASATD